MPTFVSPSGNPEVWAEKPPGYLEFEEWQAQLAAQAAAELEASYADIPMWEERKKEEIKEGAEAALVGAAHKYPEREVITFSMQEMEARAFLADASASAPLITAIATERGITVAELAAKIVENAEAYSQAAGKIIGKRQYFLDQLATAKAQAEESGSAKVIADIVVCYGCGENEETAEQA